MAPTSDALEILITRYANTLARRRAIAWELVLAVKQEALAEAETVLWFCYNGECNYTSKTAADAVARHTALYKARLRRLADELAGEEETTLDLPQADGMAPLDGWTLDYKFIQRVTEAATEREGVGSISMEQAEAVMLSMREELRRRAADLAGDGGEEGEGSHA